MRVNDVSKSNAPRPLDEGTGLSSTEVRALFVGFDLGYFPARGDLCALLGKVANALAALFAPGEPSSSVGSIVDFGDGRGDGRVTKDLPRGKGGVKSIVDFGDGRVNKGRGGAKSIVDFGDRPSSIVDFGDGKVRTD